MQLRRDAGAIRQIIVAHGVGAGAAEVAGEAKRAGVEVVRETPHRLRELAGSGDPSLRALIHNTLGDYLLKRNKPKDAFWEFLRVDVLYNTDKNEHARALYHLAKLFREDRKDGPRADACLEQLKDKRFEGTEYQKKLAEK